MGEVYLAYDRELARNVALKVLAERLSNIPDAAALLTREARAASALNHPNILTVYDIGKVEGLPFIAMEFVDGETLRHRMGNVALPPADTVAIVLQVASALAVAHEHGIVHGDIKPENVMLRSDGYVKVLDFGIARQLTSAHRRVVTHGARSPAPDEVTAPGSATEPLPRDEGSHPDGPLGTPPYMAPELLTGQPLDARSDVWSLGVMIYEMAAGRQPFAGRTLPEVIQRILSDEPPPFADSAAEGIAWELWRVASRCLCKNREKRPSSAREIKAELARVRLISRPSRTGSFAFSDWSPALPSDGIPLKPPPHAALPPQSTPLVGREDTVRRAMSKLCGDARLVTLTGPGGVGKTRLAVAIAERFEAETGVTACWVPLAAIHDPSLVPSAVASALGVAEGGVATPVQGLANALCNRRLLLVLDNFEQLVTGATVVADVLSAAGGVKVLVTSRERLHLREEYEIVVPPLETVQDFAALPAPEDLARCASVGLFVARAAAVLPGFALTADNARHIAEICARLDGLPLAIELAAARVKILPPEALLNRLGKRLSILTTGARDLPARQRTMRDAIGWSYGLLEEAERRLFRRLAVFSGSFSLEAAESVCEEGLAISVLDGVASLFDKSLLVAVRDGAGQARFRMLEVLREFGLERLAESGEEGRVRDRHAEWFFELARRAAPQLAAQGQAEWLERLDLDHDNLREALVRLMTAPDPGDGVSLAGELWWFWYLRGHYREGRRWLEAALAHGEAASPAARDKVLLGAGVLAFLQCDYPRAWDLLESCVDLARRMGDEQRMAWAQQFLGSVCREKGRYDEAIAHHQASLAIFSALGDERGVARSQNYIAFASWLAGKREPVRACLDSLATFRRLGDLEGIVWSLLNLGAAAYHGGELAQAEKLGKESLEASRQAGYREGMAWSLDILGRVALEGGDCGRALALLKEALRIHHDLGDRWRMASVLDGLARTAAATGRATDAARLLGAAEGVRRTVGTPLPAAEAPARESCIALLGAALGEAELERLMEDGRGRALQIALDPSIVALREPA